MPETSMERLQRQMLEAAANAKADSETEKPRRPKSSTRISVEGSGNTIAGGDIVNINPTIRPRIEVKTGDGVIDAKQKAEIKARIDRWIEVNNAVRRSKLTHAGAWSGFNKKMGVNSYSEMTPDQLPAARKWIGQQIARIQSMSSAPAKDGGFRGDAIKAIKARCKQLGDPNLYRPYATITFGVSSLTDMSDRQLQDLRQWVFNKKIR